MDIKVDDDEEDFLVESDDDGDKGHHGKAAGGGHGHGHVHHGNCCSHDHSEEIQVYNLPTETKLAACDAFKLEGHCFFREEQFLRARARYQKMVIYLDYTFPDTAEEEARAAVLRRTALMNMALCSLHAEELRQAISYSNQVIQDWPDYVKAYFCRAKAYRLLGEFDNARESLQKCLVLAPTNHYVLEEVRILDSDERYYNMESQEVAAEMFASSKRDKEKESVVQTSAVTPNYS